MEPANVLRIDVSMQVGTASETVTVTDEAPMLKTENSATVYNINVEQLESLPILSVNGGGTSAATNGLRDPLCAAKDHAWNNLCREHQYDRERKFRHECSYRGYIETCRIPRAPRPCRPNQAPRPSKRWPSLRVITFLRGIRRDQRRCHERYHEIRTNRYHGTLYAYGVNEALNAAQPFSGLKNITPLRLRRQPRWAGEDSQAL